MIKAEDCLIYDGAYIKIKKEDEYRLIESCAYRNPEYTNAKLLGEDTTDIPERISFAEFFRMSRDGKAMVYRLPRNFDALTGAHIHCENIRYATADNETYKFEWVKKDFELRGCQARAIQAYKEKCDDSYGTGIVSLACGKGKTVLAIRLIYELGLKTLVLADQIDLVDQWKDEIEKYLGFTPAIWRANERKTGPIVVSTLQSLHSHFERGIIDRSFFSKFSFTILDECHVAPARTFSNVMTKVRSRYVLGLSATVKREDGLTDIVHASCGPIVYQDLETDLKPVVDRIYIDDAPDNVQSLLEWARMTTENDTTGRSDGLETRIWGRAMTMLSQNVKRNLMIVHNVAEDIRRGHSVLVLTTRVEHCNELKDLLMKRYGIEAGVMVSDTKAKDRKAITQRLRSGDLKGVFATTVFKKGKDVPILSSVHLVMPVKSNEFVVQGVGRSLRYVPGKPEPVLRDYVDYNIARAYGQAVVRKRIYNKQGWVIINEQSDKKPKDIIDRKGRKSQKT